MDYDLIDKLHKLADVLEQNESIHAHSTPRKAAYTIERLYRENEQLRALTLKMDTTPREYVLRILGIIYFKYISIKKKFK